jgi:hypothetical protein
MSNEAITARRPGSSPPEHLTPVHPDKLATVLQHMRRWAADAGLTPSEVAYLAATRDRRPLRFSAGGHQATERAWRTHWLRPDLSETAAQRTLAARGNAPDLVVVEPLTQWSCAGCGGSGSLLLMEDGERSAWPAWTWTTWSSGRRRRPEPAGQDGERLAAVVVRFSRSRRRYERQGILVEEAALRQAEAQCLADEDARARRRERDRQRRAEQDMVFETQLAEAVGRLFPGCPPERVAAIARFAALRGSGRIGRSAGS